MCDFCHAHPGALHHGACPRGAGFERVPEPPPPPPPPAPSVPEHVRIARRAVKHVAEVDAVLARIRRDMMRP